MSLRGSFLIAMPHLMDPNFQRSVVLMLEDNDEGSLGLIVNRLGPIAAADLCTSLAIPWRGDRSERIYVGGPVQPGSIWMLHGGPADIPGSNAVVEGCFFATSRDAMKALAENTAGRRRFLAGYAGWGEGQLEGEVRAGAWITAEADPRLIFDVDPGVVWEAAVRSVGIDPIALVPGGGEVQ